MGDIAFNLSDGGRILRVTFDGAVDDAAFDRYLEQLRRYYQGAARLGVIMDATSASVIPAEQKKRQAAFLKANQALIRQNVAGYAFVITSPVIRLVLTGILWLEPLPVPYHVCKSIAEAETWINSKLEVRS